MDSETRRAHLAGWVGVKSWRCALDRAELLRRANDHARERGWPTITDSQLSDWREEEIVAPPVPIGRQVGGKPSWSWEDQSLDDLVEICRLRSMGERRIDQFRAYLWIAGRPVRFEDVRRSIGKEFRRIVSGERRKWRDFANKTTESQRSALLRRTGPIDPDLAPLVDDIVLAPDKRGEILAVSMIDDLAFGDTASSIDRKVAERLWGLAGLADDGGPISAYMGGMKGLFGLGDETERAAIDFIDKASEDDFRLARYFLRQQYFGIFIFISTDIFAIPVAAKEKLKTIDRAGWAIIILMQHLNQLHRLSMMASDNGG